MTTTPMDDQDKLVEFVTDPETIKRAAEGSMEKRQALLDEQELRAAIEKKLYDRVTSFKAVSYEELTDELLGIMLAQKHRWQLEARIDELGQPHTFNIDSSFSDHYKNGYLLALSDFDDANEVRIEQLKSLLNNPQEKENIGE